MNARQRLVLAALLVLVGCRRVIHRRSDVPIVGSDIYVPTWVNLFGIDYAPDEDGAWVNVD
jgi:hypothetical protein